MSIKGFKGFDKDFKCRDFQYEVGKEYETNKAKACESGFHFCENPLDVFGYYPPSTSRFAEVEGSGDIDKHDSDSKVACTRLKIGTEIGLSGIVAAGVDYILSDAAGTTRTTSTGDWSVATNTGNWSVATNTGDQSAATNTGYRSAATNTGDQSATTNTGDQSAATNTGNRSAATNTGYRSAAVVDGAQSIACGLGIESKAKGKKTCWLVLCEWVQDGTGAWVISAVKSIKVDGKKIKEDTFYTLKDGRFTEVTQ